MQNTVIQHIKISQILENKVFNALVLQILLLYLYREKDQIINNLIQKIMLQILAYLLGFEGIFIFTLVMVTVLVVGVLVENHKYNKWYDQHYNNRNK